MNLLENVSLRKYNTFGINASAKYFASFHSVEQLGEILNEKKIENERKIILGGGSNLLFTRGFDGLVLKNEIYNLEKIGEDDVYVYIRVGAGENWHRFVLFCISQNLAGVENLSLIPGNVGAGPMQNIGAYGVELKDVFYELDAFHWQEKKIVKFGLNDCGFNYRESVFKSRYKNEFVIVSVTFKLLKKPVFNISYGAIEQELQKMGTKSLTIRDVSQAVIHIRQSKLPDPAVVGNAGSFFKNPEVRSERFYSLRNSFPGIIGHLVKNETVKLAAGWLIEQCGWKGYRKGDAGCHAKQALVLVNYGNASGKEIYDLSEEILKTVQDKFGLTLEREVNIE